MADLDDHSRRARLLQNGGLHPQLAELIHSIDRLERVLGNGRPIGSQWSAVLKARDEYLAVILREEDIYD